MIYSYLNGKHYSELSDREIDAANIRPQWEHWFNHTFCADHEPYDVEPGTDWTRDTPL